jgi:hypothetical protein
MGVLTDRSQRAQGTYEERFSRHNTAVQALLRIEEMRTAMAALPAQERTELKAAIDQRYVTGVGDEIQADLTAWQNVVNVARTAGLLVEIAPPRLL